MTKDANAPASPRTLLKPIGMRRLFLSVLRAGRAAPRAAAVEAYVSLAALSLIWLGVSGLVAQQFDEAQKAAVRDTSNLAVSIEAGIGTSLSSIDQALLLARESWIRSPGEFSAEAWTRMPRIAEHLASFDLAVVSPSGQVLAGSLDVERAPSSDWSGGDRLTVSPPLVVNSDPAQAQMLLARPMPGGGSIVASVHAQELVRVNDGLQIGHGVVSVIGTDGIVRARAPARPGAVGTDVSGSALLRAAALAPSGTVTEVGIVEPVRRIYSFRRVGDRPLIVAVGLREGEVLAGWNRARWHYLMAGAGLTGLVLAAWAVLARKKLNLVRSEAALRDTLEAVGQGIVMVDADGEVAVHNRRAPEILRIPPGVMAPGTQFSDVVRWQWESCAFGRRSGSSFESFWVQQTVPGLRSDSSMQRETVDGRVIEIRTHASEDGGSVRTYEDITSRHRAEERVRHTAHHDGLTGLPNRLYLPELMTAALASRVPGRSSAVFVIGLDGFKGVNDARGHVEGDRILTVAADRLRSASAEGDALARIGGDEFALVRPDCDEAEASELAGRLVDLLTERFEAEGRPFLLGASVGVALSDDGGSTSESLLRDAETAMRRAKRDGRGIWRRYEPTMDTCLAERRLLERDLREALATDGLHLNYQPICDALSGSVVGFEALCRWRHPERGLVSPAQFIPLAEEAGLIIPLGAWVLETACAEAAKWSAPARISVNMSPPQFLMPDIAERVAAVLRKTGLDPARLDLEVTEGLVIQDEAAVQKAIGELRAQGIRVSLDDFGSGHSSLAYLTRFSFDRIKIDRGFVVGLGKGERGAGAVIRAIVALGKALGLSVLAEGVETAEQRDALVDLHCDLIQGYLYGRPMAPEDARTLLLGTRAAA